MPSLQFVAWPWLDISGDHLGIGGIKLMWTVWCLRVLGVVELV